MHSKIAKTARHGFEGTRQIWIWKFEKERITLPSRVDLEKKQFDKLANRSEPANIQRMLLEIFVIATKSSILINFAAAFCGEVDE